MTNRWLVTIEVWPHSTGLGGAYDRASVGERKQSFALKAEDMSDAMELAEHIAQGIRVNPMVWRAPIVGIVQDQPRNEATP